jgi:mannose/fructose-specific phosphotransferase system component IIA
VIRAVIITHGDLGQTLMNVVAQILGPQDGVDVITNDGSSLDHIIQSVEEKLTTIPTVLFVDFCGGSPYVACKTLCSKRGAAALISGVNLPMLFSFFTKRPTLPFAELVKTVEQDGHRGIQLVNA